jgi:hypothetical protein
MKYLLNKFLANRDGFAVAMFLAGLPFIYFLRDGIKLAPANTFFGVFLLFFPYFLSLLFKDFSRFDMPNKVGITLLSIFILIGLTYFLLRDRYSAVDGTRELLTFVLIFILFFGTLFLRRESLNETFFYLVIFLSILGAVSLIYFTFTNPLYQFGQRASIILDENGAKGGSPHTNSRGAFYGLVACVLVLKYKKRFKIGYIIPLLTILLLFVVLFLTQTMLAILASFLFLSLFFYFNYGFRQVGLTLKFLFSRWYVLLALSLGIVKGISSLDKDSDFITPITNYTSYRFNNIIKSLTGDERGKKSEVKGDESANTRIMLVGKVFERFEKNLEKGKVRYVLFGNGYNTLYVDVPHVEVLDSYGIFIFIFYSTMFFYLVKIAWREIRNPESMGTEFIAYAFIYYFVANFTAGIVIDYTRLGMYILLVRFVRK